MGNDKIWIQVQSSCMYYLPPQNNVVVKLPEEQFKGAKKCMQCPSHLHNRLHQSPSCRIRLARGTVPKRWHRPREHCSHGGWCNGHRATGHLSSSSHRWASLGCSPSAWPPYGGTSCPPLTAMASAWEGPCRETNMPRHRNIHASLLEPTKVWAAPTAWMSQEAMPRGREENNSMTRWSHAESTWAIGKSDWVRGEGDVWLVTEGWVPPPPMLGFRRSSGATIVLDGVWLMAEGRVAAPELGFRRSLG
jgi:hypothetical protein